MPTCRQRFRKAQDKPLTYFAFDLLHLNGHNLRGLPLIDRKAILAQIVKDVDDAIRFSDHIESDGEVIFRKACELHAEGIVSKRAASAYHSGRGGDWLKLKCVHEQEFVVGGFTELCERQPRCGRAAAGLLRRRPDSSMRGRTGTGFTQKTHRVLRDQLEKLRQAATPFENPPAEARKGAIWVKPKLVAQVNFCHLDFGWIGTPSCVQRSARRQAGPRSSARRTYGVAQAAHREDALPSPRRRALPPRRPGPPSHRKPAKSATEHAPVRLTHPDKILDAESQLTKQQLADYYWAIAPHMLPYIADRPVSLVRCPEGIGHPCFFQKHVTGTLPPGVESVDVPDKKTGKIEPYITLSTAGGARRTGADGGARNSSVGFEERQPRTPRHHHFRSRSGRRRSRGARWPTAPPMFAGNSSRWAWRAF